MPVENYTDSGFRNKRRLTILIFLPLQRYEKITYQPSVFRFFEHFNIRSMSYIVLVIKCLRLIGVNIFKLV